MACSYLNFYKYFLPFELLANNTIKNEIINLSSWHRSHKKKKDSLEIRVILLIFSLELEISGVAVQRILQNSEKWLWVCLSQFLLLWLWCQRCWGSSKDRYRSKRLSQILLVCLLKSQNILINNSEKWLVTRTPTTLLKKLQKLYRKRSNNWSMVSFIHNGS